MVKYFFFAFIRAEESVLEVSVVDALKDDCGDLKKETAIQQPMQEKQTAALETFKAQAQTNKTNSNFHGESFSQPIIYSGEQVYSYTLSVFTYWINSNFNKIANISNDQVALIEGS